MAKYDMSKHTGNSDGMFANQGIGESHQSPEMDKAPAYHRRKADWHDARGNKNIADSHRASAILKGKMVFDDMKDNPKKTFAFR